MSEYNPLSPGDSPYTISDHDEGTSLDDVSLASRASRPPRTSSGASVSSKFSRTSRKQMQDSELGVPLTASESVEEGEGDEGGGGEWVGAAPINNGVTSPTTAAKSYISEDDPFHMFRSDLARKLSSVDEGLDSYLTVVRTTDTAVNAHAVKEAKKQLKRHLKHAESTLSDLETTVRVVERQREKFPHIHDAELGERRRFVDDSKDRIAGAKGAMQGDEVRQKLMRDERAMTERRKGGGLAVGGARVAPTDDAANGSTHGYRDVEAGDDGERSESLMMLQQQDETLEDLDLAVTRVGYMAETIHEEIDTQNQMLKSLDEDLADAEEQLGVVMGKLAKLLKTKSKCQIGLILILSLIVLVLFFLVLYT
ncbi:hypothetical protein ACHAXT_011749 [Thalassiosira profunda]